MNEFRQIFHGFKLDWLSLLHEIKLIFEVYIKNVIDFVLSNLEN